MDKIKSQKELLEENKSLKSEIALLQKSNTKLKEYAELIEESEQQFKAFANQTAEGITVADLEGNYVYVNPVFCKMSGYSEGELLDMTVFDMKAKNQSNLSFYKSKENMEGIPIPVNLQRKDKTEYLTEIVGNNIVIGNDELVLGTIRDVTDQKLAEEKIKSSEKRYRSIFEATPIALWEEDFSEVKVLLDALKKKGVKHFEKYFDEHPEFVQECADSTIIIDVNEEAILLQGASSKEDLLNNITDFFIPESFEAFKKQLVSLAIGKNRCEIETVVKTKSGNIKQVNLRFVVAPGYDADLNKVYISIQDISSLKKIELNLIEHQVKLNEVLSIANLGSFVFDDSTDLFKASLIGDEILGIDELYKRDIEGWTNLIHPEDFERVQQFVDDIGIESGPIEFRVIRPLDKKIIWLFANFRKEHDKSGVRTIITGTFRDFTERKLMMKTLADSENMLNESQQVAKIGSYVLNFESDYWKSSLELDRIFGIDRDAKKGIISWLNLIHPDDKEMMSKYFETNVMHNHELFNKEYRVINAKTKKTLWIHGMGALEFDDKGNLLSMKGTIQDITDRKVKEENILLYNKLFSESTNEIYLIDTETYKFIDVNKSALRNLGYSEKEMQKLTPIDIKPEINLVAFEELIKPLKYKRENKIEFQTKHQRKDGTLYDADINLEHIKLGSKEYYSVFVLDVTEREKAGKKIKFLSEITQQTKTAVLTANLDFEITWVNEAFKKLYGYASEEILGKSPVILSAEFLAKDIQEEIYDSITAGNKYKIESLDKKKDGTIFPVELEVFPILDDEGHIFAYSSHIADITDRKNKENELIHSKEATEESERSFRELYEKSGDAILIIKNGEFTACNEATVKMLKYKTNELFLNTHPSKISPEFQPNGESSFKEAEKMMKLSLKKGTHRFEWIHTRRDGEEFPVEVLLTAISTELGNQIIHCVWRDITERKKIESELIKSKEKAEESNRLKTEFLHNMSHEIRTPMNGILGFTQLLDDAYLTDKKRTHFVNIIQNSGRELLHIIDDILEISKLETKQVSVVESEVCINDTFFELFSIFDLKAKEQGISLYFKKGLLDAESTIYTDKVKLNKILSNLLENALKFTSRGYVAFGYSLKKNNTLLEIYVKDTGIGIEPEKQKIIFERFSQAEKKISRKAGGLGLGLSIAKENAELLDGEITVESGLTDGATFTVTIPYKPVVKKKVVKKDGGSLKKEIPKCTILIAEDEEVNFLFLEILLIDKLRVPCKILHAIDGVEAVEMCKKDPNIDLVLMDIKMPKMNGYDATKEIKKMRPELPIVAQTAYSTREDMKKAIDAGCVEFITKPINKDILNKIIGKYLRKNG